MLTIQKYLNYIQEQKYTKTMEKIDKEKSNYAHKIDGKICDKLDNAVDNIIIKANEFTPEVKNPMNVNMKDKRIPKALKIQYIKADRLASICDKKENTMENMKILQWLKSVGIKYCEKANDKPSCYKYIKQEIKEYQHMIKTGRPS